MTSQNTRFLLRTATALFAVAMLSMAGCIGGPKVTYRQAGSSTVLPIALAWAEEFEKQSGDVSFVVEGGGSGAGLKQFCRGEIQIADASRPIAATEKTDCQKAGITPFEIPVAIDGLAVVVSRQNTFINNLTVMELNRIWTANMSKQVNRWSQVRGEWPDETIRLFGPGTDSGTFDYFNEVIIHPFDGKTAKTRSDYTPSEDDNVLVQGVKGSAYALAYFGVAYVRENEASIKALPIDEGKGRGAVLPTAANVESGTYSPLARPLFMYTNGQPTEHLLAYFEFGISTAGQALVAEVGYIPLPAAKRTQVLASLEQPQSLDLARR